MGRCGEDMRVGQEIGARDDDSEGGRGHQAGEQEKEERPREMHGELLNCGCRRGLER